MDKTNCYIHIQRPDLDEFNHIVFFIVWVQNVAFQIFFLYFHKCLQSYYLWMFCDFFLTIILWKHSFHSWDGWYDLVFETYSFQNIYFYLQIFYPQKYRAFSLPLATFSF